MRTVPYLRAFVLALSTVSGVASALEFVSTRVHVWRRGETIAGDDFLAANEAVVDYLATLRRPTSPMESIRYRCQVKSRVVAPYVTYTSGSGNNFRDYVEIRSIYDIKDCVEE